MLAIQIFNPEGSGFLEIPPGVAVQLESYMEAFQEEEGAGEYTLPGDMFWTDNNRRLLLFKERIENFNRTDNFFKCIVYDNGFPEIIDAKFTILSKAGSFNYRNGKFSFSISGSRGLFGTKLKNKKLTDFSYGGSLSFPLGMDCREFAFYHYTGGYLQYPQIRFAPVAIEKFYDEGRKDYAGEFLAKDTVNNIVFNGADWVFGRPNVNFPDVAVADSVPEYMDYRTVPFLRLKFVLQQLFIESGYTVNGEIFNNTDFDNAVIFNNYGIEKYRPNILGFHDENNLINFSNHLPDMLATDFLKAILSGLGLFISFIDGNHAELVYHNTNIKSALTVNLDEVLVDGFESDFLDGTAQENGYKIAYTVDSDDQYYSERVKDLSIKIIKARVNTIEDLDTISAVGLTTDHVVYVASENMYYCPADTTAIPVTWDAYSEGLEEYKTGTGEKAVDIPFSTLAQYVITDGALQKNTGYLGTRQFGTFISNKGTLVKNKFGLRLFYCTAPGDPTKAPISYNHNRNADNTQRDKFSLSLTSADSVTQLLIPWQNILQNAELVKVSVLSNSKVLEDLRRCRKIQLANTNFFLKKVERSIPMGRQVKLELVPL